MMKREACLIGGEWVTGDAWLNVDNPATDKIIGRVPAFGVGETRHAIASAAVAMQGWASRLAADRARVLRRLFDLMTRHRADLASLLTEEQGKPIVEALSEIDYAASFIEWFAEEAKRVYGEITPAHRLDARVLTLRQPIGVVAAITPWNFPAAMVTRKIAPALAAGCGVVLKPASQTPFSALAIGALAIEAGLPAGLLNIVTGDAGAIGGELTANPVVRKLSFTGSTGVGAKLFAQSAPTIKKLSLELGGNAPFIVFDDADIDAAVAGAIQAKFRNAGQTCVCVNRFYAQWGIHDAFIVRLTAAVAGLVIGDGNLAGAQIGPLIDSKAVAKVNEHVADAVGKGAIVETGGTSGIRDGRFYVPTVLSGVTGAMLVAREETFGPLAAVIRFDTVEDVIRQANDTEFGLAAYLYTRDLGRAWRVAEALEVGMVGINTGLISTEIAPFGGVKASGVGREGSRHGIEDYLELKYVCMGLPV